MYFEDGCLKILCIILEKDKTIILIIILKSTNLLLIRENPTLPQY